MILRDARPEDAAALAALGRDSFRAAFEHLYDPADLRTFLETVYNDDAVASEIADPRLLHRLAEDGGGLAGFCKIALQTGCHIVPSYVFGANEVYTRYFEHTGAMAKLSSVLQTSLVVWTGRWGIPMLPVPHRSKLVAVIGAPIEVTKVAEPTKEQVEALHAKFVAEVRALYDRHKGRMGAEWAARRDKLYLEDEKTPSKKRD